MIATADMESPPSPAAGGASADETWQALALSTAALALLVLVVVMAAARCRAGSFAADTVYALIGAGSAMLGWSRVGGILRRLVISVGLGLAVVVLVATVVLLAGQWGAVPAVWWALVACSAAAHLVRVLRAGLPGALALRGEVGARLAAVWPTVAEGWRVLAVTGAGLTLCAVSAVIDQGADPRPGGLPTSISPAWIVGLVILVGAVVVAASSDSPMIAAPVVALVGCLVGTPAVIYEIARYPWTQQQTGVATAVALKASLSTANSLYKAWPGFFTAVALLAKVAGITPFEQVARWWPLVVDITEMAVVREIARGQGCDRRQSWLAALFLIVCVTIGQDYFSPQSMGYLLVLTVLCVALKQRGADLQPTDNLTVAGVLICAAIAVSHPLSACMVVAFLAIFVLLRMAATWAVPAAAFAVTLGWVLSHLSGLIAVSSPQDIGHVVQNALPGGAVRFTSNIYNHIGTAGLILAPLVVLLLATVRIRRRMGRVEVALLGCAAVCLALVSVHYGYESSLRIELFAVPFLALFAFLHDWWVRRWHRILVSAAIVLAPVGYVMGNMVSDYIFVVRPGDLAVVQYFEAHAGTQASLVAMGGKYLPLDVYTAQSLWNYGYFPLVQYRGTSQDVGRANASAFTTEALDDYAAALTSHQQPRALFIITSTEGAAQTAESEGVPTAAYRAMTASFRESPRWRVIDETPTATLFKFTAPRAGNP